MRMLRPMSETELHRLLTERIDAVEARITAACRRAARPRSQVTLVAVTKTITPALAAVLPELVFVTATSVTWLTKTITPALAAVLPELGLQDLGESRPQELWRKAAILPGTVR